jgi:hypothetical protein
VLHACAHCPLCCIGQLGTGTSGTTGKSTAVDFGTGAVVTAVSVGSYFVCAVVDSTVKRWGYGAVGALGQGSTLSLGGTAATIPAKIKPIK